MMKYRKLGSSTLEVSVVGLGTWGMGGIGWVRSGRADDTLSIDTMIAGFEAGINLLDTAQPYGVGHAESLIGEAVRGVREKVIIADKCVSFRESDQGRPVRDWRPEVLRTHLASSLKNLATDYIDLYQVHWPDPNPEHKLSDAFRELNKMREEGLVRFVGVSNFTPALIEEAQQYCPIVSVQPPYCLLNRGIEDSLLPYCAAHGIGVMSYGSLGGGVLTGKYTERPTFDPTLGRDVRNDFYPYYSEERWPKTNALVNTLREVAARRDCPVAHVSIAWTLAQKGMTLALVGARNPEQVRMNAAAAEVELSADELDEITAASDKALIKL